MLTSLCSRTQSPPPLPPEHDSPDLPPVLPSNDTPSPLLAGFAAPLECPPNTMAYHTSEWANNVPFARSPPNASSNGVSISGSPPCFSPTNMNRTGPGGRFSYDTPSTSPPTVGLRQPNQGMGYQNFGDPIRAAPGMNRRTSMHSQNRPPLPHQPQPHFYGAPDVGLGIPKARFAGARAGDGPYFCGFDSLTSCGHEGSSIANTVLMVGSQGALDVLRVEKQKLTSVGRLERLRGSVLGARILPWAFRHDPMKAIRPLVAVIIHGLVIPESTAEEDRPDLNSSLGPATRILRPTEERGVREIMHYQTTVEVYSLRTQEHIVTLLVCPASPITTSPLSPLFSPPPPTGNLRLEANGKFIVIASGTSGEVFVFGPEGGNSEDQTGFTCVAKTWTSVQASKRSFSSSSSTVDTDYQVGDSEFGLGPSGSPLLSLSHRWLAVVPPVPSSRFSIGANVPFSGLNPRPPGLDQHTPPSQPQVTCSVDSPETESLLNKVAREVTQEFIKGARWVGDQGLQAWKSYWTKPPNANATADSFRTTNDVQRPVTHRSPQSFPPTHAPEESPSRSRSDPALVSILDLEKLVNREETRSGTTLIPNATFQTPSGCSCVSFAPNGIMLLTASKKGDVQYVWDLMRMLHGQGDWQGTISKPGGGPDLQGPHVRLVARFARMTVTRIVDVVWAAPRGDRLAVVTENGTAHIFELPVKALLWPPPRRSTRPVSAPDSAIFGDTDHDTAVDDKPATNPFTSAINVVNSTAQPFVAAVRRRPPSISNPFSVIGGFGVTSAVGSKSGKAVAAGFSKSVGAASGTVNTLRHVGENRLHLPPSLTVPTTGSVRWMDGKDRGRIAAVGGSIVQVYEVSQRTGNRKGSGRYPSVVGGRPTELSLPTIPDALVAPAVIDYLQADEHGDKAPLSIGGYWTLQHSSVSAHNTTKASAHPLSFAEIETNPPYQPFHTDPRINLFIYDDPQSRESEPVLSQNNSPRMRHNPRVFGEEIPATKINLGSVTLEAGEDADTDRMENLTTIQKRDDNLDQIVVTTRRRRGRPSTDEEEFFEDDCEVVDFAEDRV